MSKDIVIGIDIGGQSSKIGVVNKDGEIISRSVIRSDIYGKDADSFITALANAVKALIDESGTNGKIKGIGVGAPNGNYYDGTISMAPNLEWASEGSIEFTKMLSEKMGGIEVSLTNDANAAAAGEMMYGAAKGMKNFIMITLGTGVGSGIVIDGRLVYGHDGFAGELGHVCAVRDSDRVCGCGKKGCLECYCSATGVARSAKEFLKNDNTSLLNNIDGEISSKDVYDAAKAGDTLALEIFKYTAEILGRSLADFVAFSSPEAIILFGGLARSKEFLYEPMAEAMNNNLMRQWKGKIKILFSELKESDAAILGASALAWD